ncbi:Panacea domain-containing protein [Endozoicomonas numazuensis]|uniref:Panacea domain-containing protein n=1 Tax=Endozoicomonas numazuensis TaxID=1137799 RepID=UPI00068CA983|nr:type II toxin-antitoxin system antitoxin SocA domain-containing protein [Endozoicomonas numazuensis]
MKKGIYPAVAIANAFLETAQQKQEDISPMKLQKLVYFAHALSLAVYHRPLIDEPVYAWKFGPVIKSVYNEFRAYGYQPIHSLGTLIRKIGLARTSDEGPGFEVCIPKINPHDHNVRNLIDQIWELYGGLSAHTLSNLTHKPGSPWEITRNEHQNGEIPDYELSLELIETSMMKELGLMQEEIA